MRGKQPTPGGLFCAPPTASGQMSRVLRAREGFVRTSGLLTAGRTARDPRRMGNPPFVPRARRSCLFLVNQERLLAVSRWATCRGPEIRSGLFCSNDTSSLPKKHKCNREARGIARLPFLGRSRA